MQNNTDNIKAGVVHLKPSVKVAITMRQEPDSTYVDTTAREMTQSQILPTFTYNPTVNASTPRYDDSRTRAYLQHEIWTELQRHSCTWNTASVHTKSQLNKGEHITLTAGEHFSASANDAFGESNTINILNLDDHHLLITVYEGLVEQEAIKLLREENKYLSFIADMCHNGITIFSNVSQDGRFVWRNVQEHTDTGFVSLIMYLLTLCRLDALATLANIVGMNFSNMYQLSDQVHVAESKGHQNTSDNIPRAILIPPQSGDGVIQLVGLQYICGHSGQVIGAIAVYSLNGKTFCLPAAVGNGSLCIAKYKPTAHFLNQDQMDKRSTSPIIFCQDMRTAITLQNMLNGLVHSSTDVIVTAHLGTDLKVLPWNYFSGHDVVFVCAPTKACMARVKGYNSYLQGANTRSFKIWPGFLLHSTLGCDVKTISESSMTEGETELLHYAIVLDEIESVVCLLRQIITQALPYDEYKAWGQARGIFARPKGQKDIIQSSESTSLRFFDPDSVTASLQPRTLAEVKLQHILPPATITMLHGLKNAGKSSMLLALIYALASGKAAFDIFPSNGRQVKVLLADSETPTELFGARQKQFALNQYFKQYFFPLRKENIADTVEGAAVLTNPNFTAVMEDAIAQHSIEYQVIDNITTFSEQGKTYQQNSVAKVLDWAAKLNAKGVTTIFAHHSLDDAKNPAHASMRGSNEYSIRAHTEMVVIGKQQLLEDNTLATEKVRDYANRSGATMGLHFKCCKHAAILEGHTFWFHLSLNSNKFNLLDITDGGDNVVSLEALPIREGLEDTFLHSSTLAPLVEADETEIDLTIEERKVFEFVKQNEKATTEDEEWKATTKKITKLLNCGDTHAREVLSSLCKKQLLEQTGTGPQTGYQLLNQA